MLEVLTSVPAYSAEHCSRLTEQEYTTLVGHFRQAFNRAAELFEAYWKTGNTTLFDMSLEALEKARYYMGALMDSINNPALWPKLSRRATFTMGMAATMLGAP